jgi:hypothetical protein
MWNSAAVRSFNVGVQAGKKPDECNFKIQAHTVKAVAAVNADIVFTVYGTDMPVVQLGDKD